MCEICGSVLAAEHRENAGAALCPQCGRFPLDAEVPLDPSQWDYVGPELQNPTAPISPATPDFVDVTPAQVEKALQAPISQETDKEADDRVQTCYHCYQIDSGLAERCPVCGDSYLPPSMREPYHA